MKVRLLVRNKIDGEAGEIVEVSPDRSTFLISYNGAELVKDVVEQTTEPEKPKVKKGRK